MIRLAASVLLAQIGWLGSVGGGAAERPWLGAGAALTATALLLVLSHDRGGTLKLVLVVGLVGPLADAVQISLGTVRPHDSPVFPLWVPVWLWALWPLFASAMPISFRWLAGRFGLAAALGAVAGPLAYLGGAKLGACELHPELWRSVVAIGLEWALMLPFIVWLAARLVREPGPAGAGVPRPPQEAAAP